MRPLPSLRLRLLCIIGGSLLSVWSLVAVWMLADVHSKMSAALDDRLAASARMVAGIVTQLPPALEARRDALPQALDVVARDGLACEVSLIRGEVMRAPMARTAHSPGLATVPTGYGTATFGGRQWRTFVLETGGLRIATADRLDVREGLVRDVALTAGLPFGIALLASLALLWIGIGRGLQPLERLRALLARRRPDDATPLPPLDSPAELKPLVDTIDRLLKRMHAAIERERRFTDDAAHELRSPLTGIKTHLQVLRLALLRPGHQHTATAAVADAEQGVQALQSTLDQLLTLARLDAPRTGGCTEPADAEATARAAIAEAGQGGDAAPTLTVDLPDGGAAVAVPEPLLRAALRNLVDNALRHGAGAGGPQITVDQPAPGQVRFRVRDQGRGMAEPECAQAVQRFWRQSPGTPGSGLGLPIVQAIAQGHGGTLGLQPAAPRGLIATLTLPVCG